MTLAEDKLIVFTNNILPLPMSLWREEKMSCGIPGNYQLTSEILATDFKDVIISSEITRFYEYSKFSLRL